MCPSRVQPSSLIGFTEVRSCEEVLGVLRKPRHSYEMFRASSIAMGHGRGDAMLKSGGAPGRVY
jgi:hypothetical protein